MDIKVDRTCPCCKKDRGILQEVRFYDFDALRGTTERKYPLRHGGILNIRFICGKEECFNECMRQRKADLETSL